VVGRRGSPTALVVGELLGVPVAGAGRLEGENGPCRYPCAPRGRRAAPAAAKESPICVQSSKKQRGGASQSSKK